MREVPAWPHYTRTVRYRLGTDPRRFRVNRPPPSVNERAGVRAEPVWESGDDAVEPHAYRWARAGGLVSGTGVDDGGGARVTWWRNCCSPTRGEGTEGLSIVDCRLGIVDCRLSIADCRLRERTLAGRAVAGHFGRAKWDFCVEKWDFCARFVTHNRGANERGGGA